MAEKPNTILNLYILKSDCKTYKEIIQYGKFSWVGLYGNGDGVILHRVSGLQMTAYQILEEDSAGNERKTCV